MRYLIAVISLLVGCVDTELPTLTASTMMPTSHAQAGAHGVPLCTEPGLPCDDHDACTDLDECGPELSCTGIPRECDDGIECTEEACHPAIGECEYDTWNCDCDGAESCDDSNPCTLDYCDFERTGCAHEAVEGDWCEDDDPCTEDSTCQSDGTCGRGSDTCLD